MPSKWLTWSAETVNDTNLELTKPTKPSEVASEWTFVSVSAAGHLPRLREEAKIFPHCPRCASYALYRKDNTGNQCENLWPDRDQRRTLPETCMTSENNAIEAIDSVEKWCTPQQLAKSLPMTPQTIVRQFRGSPGVIENGSDEKMHKRKRKFLLISESAKSQWIEEHRTDKK